MNSGPRCSALRAPIGLALAAAAFGLGARPHGARPVVCIDPGHPSEVSAGDERINGITEVHANWLVALKLRADLEARGVTVCLTKRREDALVRNRDRAEIANRAGAALLVRLHCDDGRDSGFAVYYPDREGTAEGRTGPSRAVQESSARAARTIHAALADALKGRLNDEGLFGDVATNIGSKQGALTGSIFSDVPVVLIEMVVLTHTSDAAFIRSDSGSSAIAAAIATGVVAAVTSAR